jgi:hypothetical protein
MTQPIRAALWLGVICVWLGACAEHRRSLDTRPQVQYISDPSLFKTQRAESLTVTEEQAIAAAKEHLAQAYDRPARGQFSIAPTQEGYQVNFRQLERREVDGNWSHIPEGFGEAWIREGRVIRADVGP